MSVYIPPELWPDILAKLPVEDIIRCTGVCKSWYSLITSSAFLSLHTQSLANKKNRLLLVRNYGSNSQLQEENFSAHLDDNTFSEYRSFDFSLETLETNYRLVYCLNGVVCFTRTIYRFVDIILWNPSIRKYLRLPNPTVPYDTQGYIFPTTGLGFDESTNDFKVVRVLNHLGKKNGVLPHAEVYKLSEGCWRRIIPVGLGGVMLGSSDQVFLEGSVHWFGWKCGDDEKDLIIVSFDIHNEVFDVMSGPGCLSYPLAVHFLVMGESLSLIHRKVCGHNEEHCIWVMKQYGVADSWTKLFNICSPAGPFRPILCFRKNSEGLYSYDASRNRVDEFKLFRNERFDVVNFIESLALFGVKGQHGMETKTEDIDISKEYPDVHARKKTKKTQASGEK